MLQDNLNQQIADTSGIAMRAVEGHRGRVLDKMGVRGTVELGT